MTLELELSFVLLPMAILLATAVSLALGAVHEPVPAPASHALKRRLKHARMSKMLRRLHVHPSTYLERLGSGVIEEHLETCTACPHQFQCDQALACKRSALVDLSFCPNRAAVLEQVRTF